MPGRRPDPMTVDEVLPLDAQKEDLTRNAVGDRDEGSQARRSRSGDGADDDRLARDERAPERRAIGIRSRRHDRLLADARLEDPAAVAGVVEKPRQLRGPGTVVGPRRKGGREQPARRDAHDSGDRRGRQGEPAGALGIGVAEGGPEPRQQGTDARAQAVAQQVQGRCGATRDPQLHGLDPEREREADRDREQDARSSTGSVGSVGPAGATREGERDTEGHEQDEVASGVGQPTLAQDPRAVAARERLQRLRPQHGQQQQRQVQPGERSGPAHALAELSRQGDRPAAVHSSPVRARPARRDLARAAFPGTRGWRARRRGCRTDGPRAAAGASTPSDPGCSSD